MLYLVRDTHEVLHTHKNRPAIVSMVTSGFCPARREIIPATDDAKQ